METGDCQYLFKETRLNLEPSSSTFVVNIKVSPPANSKGLYRRHTNGDGKDVDEESTFALKNLASASSLFQRQWSNSPSSFLWRVLEDGLVLSVRAVDVCRPEKAPEAPFILNFHFSVPIQPSCVALADPRDHDALCIFVIDQANNLFSFTLRPDLFRRRASDSSIKDGCSVFHPQVAANRHPHRLVAVDSDQLLVTFRDGGLVRLDRNKMGDSVDQPWLAAPYNSQTWSQGLRNLLPIGGGTMHKFGKIQMDYRAATSVQLSKAGLHDMSFLFTVCVDHRLRVWNYATGQILHTVDMLNSEHNPQDIGKWLIDPTQSNLVRVVEMSTGRAMCVTFSPIGPGEFKFWKVHAKNDTTISLEDAYPDEHFVPNAPSLSDAWTLADFAVSRMVDGRVQLWMLWKNNTTYRVQRLHLSLKEMGESWESGCDAVYYDGALPTAQTSGPCDATDTTEKWLQVILCPGRFTRATLETALAMYERGLGRKSEERGRSSRSLAESICSVLASTATLDRSAAGGVDYGQFRSSSEIHWRRFYRLLMELDKQRGEAVSLVLDADTDMTWVVCADAISAVRECSPIEKVCHNLSRPDEDDRDQSNLISTALSFLDVFPDHIWQICNAVLRPELFEDSTKTDLERIQYFSDKAGFWRGITEEDCAPVVENLGQNFKDVTFDLYDQILNLVEANDFSNWNIRHPLTEFGRKLMVKAVRENLELQWKVCFSQLVLLVHMEFEFDQEEDALHHRVDIGTVFRRLVVVLRRLELLRWLSKTEISVPIRTDRSSSGSFSGGSPSTGPTGSTARRPSDDTQVITALEGSVGHLLGFGRMKDEPLAVSITEMVANLCAPDSDFEISPPHVQCFLIKINRADLALELAPFCDQNPFSAYVQGRVLLALRDYAEAAIHFKKAAIGLSVEDAKTDRHSVGLLDDTEWNLLYKGMAKYYWHIVSLFEKQKAYSYVVEFSRLALQFVHAAAADAAAMIKTEMLSRQFSAAVAISHFGEAHSALLAMTDHAIQHSSLRKLVERMCDSCHNMELIALPFPGLDGQVDDILTQKCRAALDVMHGTPYHRVLYSWKISRNDYRGAAAVLMDSIQKLKHAGEGDKLTGEDMLDTPVTKQYLLLINALSCVDEKQAWIFCEDAKEGGARAGAGAGAGGLSKAQGKRRVVTLGDVRKEYQDELDRIAAIQNNQFGFEADDAMEIL